MQFVVSGKNLHLSNALKDYSEKKLAVIKKYFDHIIEIDVTLSVDEVRDATRSKVCEVTVFANGIVMRAKKASEDLYASIDMVAEKIERQIKKYKEKLKDVPRRATSHRDRSATHKVISFESEQFEVAEKAEKPVKGSKAAKPVKTARTLEMEVSGRPSKIVRSGTFAMKPMFADEAADQLEILKQGFFVFSNAETNQVNVIYKRTDGNYGLIEPEY